MDTCGTICNLLNWCNVAKELRDAKYKCILLCFHSQLLYSCVFMHPWVVCCLFLHLHYNQETGKQYCCSTYHFKARDD